MQAWIGLTTVVRIVPKVFRWLIQRDSQKSSVPTFPAKREYDRISNDDDVEMMA